MQTANIQNVAGSCSTLCSNGPTALNRIGQNLKMAGTAAWDTLKKAGVYVSQFFAKMGTYLYQGALIAKGAVMHGFSLAKNYVSNHPREMKIAAVSAGIGAAFAALIGYLCCRTSSQPSAVYENVVVAGPAAQPDQLAHA